ncbi:MAG: hypothetical protein H9W80_14435 [Enterococcus sp.]|nr:hypothetical protein [Enterococcus sp.]
MIFIIFIELLICTLITYFWIWGSHIYIDLSRNIAASSYPGDITFIEKVIYQLIFPTTLFGVLCIFTFLLYLTFKNKLNLSSSKKKIVYIIPLICTIYIFVNIYNFLFH